jgi:hypothetical protein
MCNLHVQQLQSRLMELYDPRIVQSIWLTLVDVALIDRCLQVVVAFNRPCLSEFQTITLTELPDACNIDD